MVEQAKILEHHADPPAHVGNVAPLEHRHVAPEQRDQPARRLERQEQQPEQRRLAGSRRAGQEGERPRRQLEGDVAQDFRPPSISEPDIVQADHVSPFPEAIERPLNSDLTRLPLAARTRARVSTWTSSPPANHHLSRDASTMIVTCPSCATRNALPMHAHRQLVRCRGCGHGWLESSAVDLTDAVAGLDPSGHRFLDDPLIEDDALAIAKAAREAAERHAAALRRRRAELRGWAILALVIAVPLALLMLFPDRLAPLLPGAARLYMAVGLDAGIARFTIRGVEQSHELADGTRVLALRGEVVNSAGSDHRVPDLAFRLKDGAGREVYAWTLEAVATRPSSPARPPASPPAWHRRRSPPA